MALFRNLQRVLFDVDTGDIVLSDANASNECASFQHEQTTPKEEWKIVNSFTTAATIVECYEKVNGEYIKLIPDEINYTNANEIRIKFSKPQAGVANLFFICGPLVNLFPPSPTPTPTPSSTPI